MKKTKWKAILGLIGLILAIVLDLSWIWGLLFLFWGVMNVILGELDLIERVKRKENPILFWSISICWIFSSALMTITQFKERHLDQRNMNFYKSIEIGKPTGEQFQDSIYYSKANLEAFQLAGIQTRTNLNNSAKDLSVLWEKFLEQLSENRFNYSEDQKIFVNYDDFGFGNDFRVTIGVDRSQLEELPQNWQVQNISTTSCAVVEVEGKEQEVASSWERIFQSDLPKDDHLMLEIYQFNQEMDYQASIWVSVHK